MHGLLLPEDVRFFSEGDEDLLVRRLQWHTVVVISLSILIHLLKYKKYSSVLTLVFALPVRTDDPYPWQEIDGARRGCQAEKSFERRCQ